MEELLDELLVVEVRLVELMVELLVEDELEVLLVVVVLVVGSPPASHGV